jgi:acetyl-CoA carboxylase carboxyltransferase component
VSTLDEALARLQWAADTQHNEVLTPAQASAVLRELERRRVTAEIAQRRRAAMADRLHELVNTRKASGWVAHGGVRVDAVIMPDEIRVIADEC